MSRTIHRLKPLAVDKAKNPGRYADGGGLYLVVKPGPRKSWAFIYRRGAKMTELGLGSATTCTLVDGPRGSGRAAQGARRGRRSARPP